MRDTAGDNVARVRTCSSEQATAVLAAYAREMKTPTPASVDKFAHVRLVEHYGSSVRNCLNQPPGQHAEVAKALSAGLRLEADLYSSPEVYLMMAAWAEANAPKSAAGWLDDAERSAKAQKYGHGDVFMNRVLQWRVLKAMKAGDSATAKKLLGGFSGPGEGYAALPELTMMDVGTRWVFEGRQVSVAKFIAGIEDALGIAPTKTPEKPGSRTKRR